MGKRFNLRDIRDPHREIILQGIRDSKPIRSFQINKRRKQKMKNELDMKIYLEFKVSHFKENFLQSEVRGSLAFYGDDILWRLKDEYVEYAKQYYPQYFTRDILYNISNKGNKIILTVVP